MAAAAVIALVLLLPERVDPPVDTWRGAAVDVELFRVRLGEAASQGALVRAREGDRLQYTVTPGGAGWLQIYNLQDDGQVQAYLEPREVAAKLAVSSAVVLDSYAGTERIFILLSAEPISLEQVERAAEAAFHTPLADLDALPGLGAAVSQRSVLVIKESAP